MGQINLKEIAEGFGNLLNPKKNDDIESLANARTSICHQCENFRKTSNTCGICYCYIPAKTRCKECACPEKHW